MTHLATTIRHYEEVAARAKQFIRDNFDDSDLTLARFCQANPGYTQRSVQRALAHVEDKGWRELMQTMRMQIAGSRVINTTEPFSKIGISVGYTQPSQFARVFKKHWGMTPSEFRCARGATYV